MKPAPLEPTIRPQSMGKDHGLSGIIALLNTRHHLMCSMKLQVKSALHDIAGGILPAIPSKARIGHIKNLVKIKRQIGLP